MGISSYGKAVFVLAIMVEANSPALAQQSLTCQFTSGPRAGSTIDFTGVQGANPGPIGSPCQDGLGSGGILVAPNGSSSPSAQTNVGNVPNISATCQFTAGPRTGQIIDFQGVPACAPRSDGAAMPRRNGKHGGHRSPLYARYAAACTDGTSNAEPELRLRFHFRPACRTASEFPKRPGRTTRPCWCAV